MRLFKIENSNRKKENAPSQQLADASPTKSNSAINPNATQDFYLACPSFEDEPWLSRAQALRPNTLIFDLTAPTQPPLANAHPYVRLIREFLSTVPDECWIDEDNDVD